MGADRLFGRPRARTTPVALTALVVLLGAVGAGWAAGSWRPDTRPPLTAAMTALPQDTRVLGFTDWARVRQALGGSVEGAAARDLSTRSVLHASRAEMARAYGWSVADLAWEAYGQGAASSVTVLRPSATLDWDVVVDGLRDLGYTRSGDRWSIDGPTLRALGVSDLLTEVALVPRERLVLISDEASSVRLGLDVLAGREPSLVQDRDAVAVARGLAGADALLMQAGRLGCDTAAMPDGEAARQADVAQTRAGRVAPYEHSGRAIVDRGGDGPAGQQLRFAMAFDSSAQAAGQAQVRGALASGPFIGRTGALEETLRLRDARARGRAAVLTLDHDPDTDVFMVGTGPLLLASC